MNKNGPHSHTDLNGWPPGSGAFEGLAGMALSEEVCYWRGNPSQAQRPPFLLPGDLDIEHTATHAAA